MAQLAFEKYTIVGTAQELADYVFAYEAKQIVGKNTPTEVQIGTGVTITENPSGV